MNCEESFEALYLYLDNQMDGLSVKELEIHLKRCRCCWDRFEFEKKLKERCRKSCREEPCPETLLKRIKDILDKF